MKKYFKIFSLLLIAGLGFFLGTNITKAVTAHEFFYDYEFNIKMPTTLTNGENDIILSPVETNPNNTNVELDTKISLITLLKLVFFIILFLLISKLNFNRTSN